MQANQPCRAELTRCEPSTGTERTFRVCATPITGDQQHPCGALVTWVETTDLEVRRGRLCQAIEHLTEDRTHPAREFEPTDRDRLTDCLSRYGLYEQLECQATLSLPKGQGLGLVLLGIDHFSAINHSFGKSGGDVVLRQVAESLQQHVGSQGVVSRFGADQFAVLCVAIGEAECLELAGRLWQAVGQLTYRQRVLQFSAGWTWRPARDTTSQQLVQEAETALLAAKHSGRNQTCDYRALADREDPSALTLARVATNLRSDSRAALSARMTTALSALLELRAPYAAQRGRRLAHSCRLAAQGLMTAQDALVLEMAACLYPLGQIGWPDELLSQLAPPTAAMRPTMAFYDRVATNVVGYALGCPQVTRILTAMQMTQYRRENTGEELPQSARLLLIADEYDRIAFDSRGERLITPALAFQQLRQLAEHRLDKYLVEHFVEQLQADGTTRMQINVVDTGQLVTVQEQQVLNELREIRVEIAARERVADVSLHTMQHAHLF